MSDVSDRLIAILADGQVHSGEAIAGQLEMSRAAVWKQVKALSQLGLSVESIKGRGYSLPRPLELLSGHIISADLLPTVIQQLESVNVVSSCASTNTLINARSEPHGLAYFAEHQQSGRGRRGRPWLSPFGENVYCSVGWLCEGGVQLFSGFSLAVGVVTARWLSDLGVSDVSLKWPNDILVKGKKLGGILIEISGDLHGQCCLAVGVGLNVDMRSADIDQPWTSLGVLGYSLGRNSVAAGLLNQLVLLLSDFANTGFTPYLESWSHFDSCYGRQVDVHSGDRVLSGTCLGVNQEGALLLEGSSGLQVLTGGEVSLRLKQ